MDITNTVLGDEIDYITKRNNKAGSVARTAVIHTPGEDVECFKVLNYDEVMDYISNYCPEITITLLLPAGKHAYKVLPNKTNLEISLTVTKAGVASSDIDNSSYGNIERYRAIVYDGDDSILSATGQSVIDENTMDLADFAVVQFQLFNKSMEQFSLRSTGGIFRKTKVEDIVRSVLIGESSRVDVDDDYKMMGVDMVPALQVQPREHFVIPHGTPAYDVLGYIHKNCGGIYPTGLSYFYQNDYWYVFPPYDNTRFEKDERTLTIIQVPSGKMPSTESTWVKHGSSLRILSTGNSDYADDSEATALNEGNGVRFTDATDFFNSPVVVEGNKAVVSRAKQNNEFMASARDTGINNVVNSSERITANTLYQSSKLASREGSSMQLMWDNSAPEHLIPGMQVKILYYKDSQVKERRGCLIGMHNSIAYTGQGLLTGKHIRQTALHLFVQKKDYVE